jgi:uncharacterized protein YlxW (UPF0749 family)
LELTALLLNELQKQKRKNKELSQENPKLRSKVEKVRAEQAREHAVFDERLAGLKRSVWASQPAARLSAVALRTEAPSQARRP